MPALFFGNLIKSAVSRQREFLADASAVQFTRNPEGIAGALKKIGGFGDGSLIESPSANEVSHMFFGQAVSFFMGGLFATHPPLSERIQRLDQHCQGSAMTPVPGNSSVANQLDGGVSALQGSTGATPAPGYQVSATQLNDSMQAHMGEPQLAHRQYAQELLVSLSPSIQQAAHEPYGARALVYGLLLDKKPQVRHRQLQHLAAQADSVVFCYGFSHFMPSWKVVTIVISTYLTSLYLRSSN